MDSKGKVVSVSDLVIASTAYKNARLLHIDSDFKMIAEHFNVEEEMMI